VVAVEVEAAVAVAAELDRVGIGWRHPLAAGIYSNLDAIDVVEVIAENCIHSKTRDRNSLRALGRELPLLVHGVGLGPASVSAVDEHRLSDIARVIGALQPSAWSEHLSFVRSGGYEIGHLAAPPRSTATIEGAARNLQRLRQVVGTSPAVENIATLMEPPASSLDEPEWVAEIAAASGAPLLLDLQNLFANAVNFGQDPVAYLMRFPLHRVSLVHISGGVLIDCPSAEGGPQTSRLLDDHLHDVPEPVYHLLETLGERCTNPLSVVLERDGRYPGMSALMDQLRRARCALAAGRARSARQQRQQASRHALLAT
jgi:uncharacterized protein